MSIPVKVDRFRRYFPRAPIDWSEFPHDFDTKTVIKNGSDALYDKLTESIIAGCESLGVTFQEELPDKVVYRFSMSTATREARSEMRRASYQHGQSKQILSCSGLTAEQRTATERALHENFHRYRRLRNRYYRLVKKDKKLFFL